jgi:hypothetical protein
MEAVHENRAAVVVGLGTDVSENKQKDLSLGAALPSDIRQFNKGTPTREYPGEKPGVLPSAGCMVANALKEQNWCAAVDNSNNNNAQQQQRVVITHHKHVAKDAKESNHQSTNKSGVNSWTVPGTGRLEGK